MKRISTIIVLSLMWCCNVNAQRYLEEIFTDVTVTSNVTYGMNATVLYYSVLGEAVPEALKMDVYEPTGDTETDRPLILYFHTGNFLPTPQNGSPLGKRDDLNVVEMCTRLAKMGYVVASCDYRLGWNPVASTQDERVYTLINAAYRGVQDCRTAIRYFRMTEATMSDPYGIDPNRVCVWGQGTGGYIAFAAATIDEYTDIAIPKFTHDVEVAPGTIIPLPMVLEPVNGNIYGTSVGINPQNGDTLSYINHEGYSSSFNVMVNMGGALGDSSWVDAGDPPMISFHAPTDPFAPYDIGTVIVPGFLLPVVEVSGSYNAQMHASALGLNEVFHAADDAGDVYTTQANLYNDGYYGLYPLNRPEGMEADSSPWDWWNSDNPNNANGLASNPDMSMAKGMLFHDTIQGYAAPRIMCALELPGSPCAGGEGTNDACADAVDINESIGGEPNVYMELGPYSNVDATGGDVDPADVEGCWVDVIDENASIDNTLWFTFTGDGEDYAILTDDCGGESTFASGDTQIAIYSESCEGGTLVACNDDYSFDAGIYWAAVLLPTVEGTTYYVVVDGFNYLSQPGGTEAATTGDFCLQVAQFVVGVDEIGAAEFNIFPNPAKDQFLIQGKDVMTRVDVRNMVGELVFSASGMNTSTYRVQEQLASGVYLVDVYSVKGKTTKKIIIN